MLTNNIELVGENVASALTLVGKKKVYLFGYLGWWEEASVVVYTGKARKIGIPISSLET